MAIYFTPVHNHRNAKTKNELYKIHIRVYINRTRFYLPVDNFPKLKKTQWKDGRVLHTHHGSTDLNKIISTTIVRLEEYTNHVIAETGAEPTLHMIRQFHTSGRSSLAFIPFATRYIEGNLQWKNGTRKSYKTTVYNLTEFDSGMELRHFSRDFVERFTTFLVDKGMVGETIRKHIIKLKTLYMEACKKEGITPDILLFKKLSIPKWEPHPDPLTRKEVNKIENLMLAGKLAYIRDVFLFMCYTGLYLSDIKELTAEHIMKYGKRRYLTNSRFKNDNVYVIPLWMYPQQLVILKKYLPNHGNIFKELMTDYHFNKYLKQLTILAEIKRHTTNRTARYTFTTNMVARGFPRSFVSKMLGHKNERSIEHYYTMSSEMILSNIDQFMERPVVNPMR